MSKTQEKAKQKTKILKIGSPAWLKLVDYMSMISPPQMLDIASELGIDQSNVWRARQKPEFRAAVQLRIRTETDGLMPAIITVLRNMCLAQTRLSLGAIRLLLQWRGELERMDIDDVQDINREEAEDTAAKVRRSIESRLSKNGFANGAEKDTGTIH